MFSADNVLINFNRAPIIQMDPRTMGVTAQVAHDLGLSDGQIVQATVEVRDNKVGLILKGFLVDAPTFKIDAPTFKIDAPTFKIDAPNWNQAGLKSGDTVQLKANITTNGWILTPNPNSSNPINSVNSSNLGASSATAPTNPAGTSVGGNLGVNTSLNASATGVQNSPINSLANAPVNPSANALANAPDVISSSNSTSAKTLASPESPTLAGTGAQTPNVVPNWSTRLNTLIFEPSQLSAVFELLMPGALSRALPQPQLQNWLQRWNANRLSMASLNPTALKNVVLAQSIPIERQLLGISVGSRGGVSSNISGVANNNSSNETIADATTDANSGAINSDHDPKTMLRSLSALLEKMQPTPETTKLSHQLKIATHELESAQVQTAQHLMRGELAFHVVVPFWDADPVDLYFKKSKNNKDGEAEHHVTVDIHSKSRLLGEIWLNTSIRKSTQIDLVMWAIKPEVAELAKTNASELGYELGVSGLTLNSFQIFNAPKPSEVQSPIPRAGSVLDARV